jgi:hypothetical protein
MPGRGSYRHDFFADEVPPIEAMARVGAREVRVQCFGRTKTVRVDPTAFSCAALVDELADVWVDYCADAAGTTLVEGGAGAIRQLGRFVDQSAQGSVPTRLAEMSVGQLEAWQRHLAECRSPLSQMPSTYACALFELIRYHGERRPGAVSAAVMARVAQPTTYRTVKGRAVPDFSASELATIQHAAKHELLATEARIARGRALAVTGEHPDVSGWDSLANLAWLAARGTLSIPLLRQHLPGRWRDLPDGLRRHVRASVGRKSQFGELHDRLYRMVFPTRLDLMGHLVLLCLHSGAPPECVKDLTIEAVLQDTPGEQTRIAWTKWRAHRSYNQTYPDRGAFSVGRVLRSLVRITEASRAIAAHSPGGARLWVGAETATNWDGVLITPIQWNGIFRDWIERREIDVGGPLDLRRLRKTHKTARALALGGVVSDVADDHTTAVFKGHYLNSTVLQMVSGRVITKVQRRLHDQLRAGPTIVTPDVEQCLVAGDATAADLARLSARQISELVAGRLDMGLSSCRDAWDSPFAAEPGELCPVSLTSCYGCANSLVTQRSLPATLVWLDQAEVQRRRLSPPVWSQLWGEAHHVITEVILPAFSDESVAEARRRVDDAPVFVPPGLTGQSSR